MTFAMVSFDWIHQATAFLFNDYFGTPPRNYSRHRVYSRAIISALLTIFAIVYMIFGRVPLTQTTTIRRLKQRWFENRNFDKDYTGILNCPCNTNSMDYNNITTFVAMYGNGTRVIMDPSTFPTTFCNQIWNLPATWPPSYACVPIVQKCSSLYIGNTVPTPDLLMPNVLTQTIASMIMKTCLEQQRYYRLLLIAMKTAGKGNKQPEITMVDGIANSLMAALMAFSENPTEDSEEAYYWNAPTTYYPVGPSLLTLMNITFKIDYYYLNYRRSCNPPFCDERIVLQTWFRVYLGLTQVGGITAITLLIARTGWSLLAYFLGKRQMTPPPSIGGSGRLSRGPQTPSPMPQT